jgi:hypothetical protein
MDLGSRYLGALANIRREVMLISKISNISKKMFRQCGIF